LFKKKEGKMREFKLPQWPQTISLVPGQAKRLAFPVVSAGSIRIEAHWKGEPIDLKLFAPDGSIARSISNQSPPDAKLAIDVTPKQILKNILWIIEVQSASGGEFTKVKNVEIQVVAPPITPDNYKILTKKLSSQLSSNLEALEQLVILLRQLEGDDPPIPFITDIIPAHAYTGETITIKGNYFALVDGQNEVWFSVDGDLKSNIAANGVFQLNDESLTVNIPPLRFDPHKNTGTIYVRRIYDDKRSDFKEFIFDAKLPPNILSASPAAAKEADLITLNGENFGSDRNNLQVIFILADGTNLTGVIQTVNDTQMTVVVPAYISDTNIAGQIVIKRKYVADWMDGNPFSFLFLATVPGVTNYWTWNPNLPEYKNADSHTLSPKGVLEIDGAGFGTQQGEVFFRPLPGENVGNQIIWPGDQQMIINSSDWTDSGIIASLPDNSYFPFMGEFYIRITRPSGQIVDSTPLPIHILPSYFRKAINFSAQYVDVGAPAGSANGSDNDDSWSRVKDGIAVMHNTDVLSGRSGNDLFFWDKTITLNNYFVVDQVLVNVISNNQKTSATIKTSNLGTNNPATKIFWGNSVDIGFFNVSSYPLSYLIYIYLRGPCGYDYL
jgi:hypothetical protein